jgi:hypothetical protein
MKYDNTGFEKVPKKFSFGVFSENKYNGTLGWIKSVYSGDSSIIFYYHNCTITYQFIQERTVHET